MSVERRQTVPRSVARDVQMNMTEDMELEYRRTLRDLHQEMKATPGQRPTLRQALGSRIDTFPPELRIPIQTFVTRCEMGPKVGEEPLDFFLKRMGFEERVQLSSFRGKRPVALVFGSYS